MIRITTPQNGMATGTKVFTECGAEIEGLTSIVIRIKPNRLVCAEIECITGGIDVLAHPLLGLETVVAAAKAHGHEVVVSGTIAELKAYREATVVAK